MPNYVSMTSDKSKRTAFWLCLLFGFFGLHYFYVGRIGRGLLALFTGDFFGIGWIADLFKIMLGKFTDNTGAYLRQK